MNAVAGATDRRGRSAATAAIRVSALVKWYGHRQALKGIDLDVPTGEVFGFVGPNGAGKSTTIRCLLDLIRPTSGHIEILDGDPRVDGVSIRGRIGYVPGELRLPERMTTRQLVDSVARLRGGLDEGVVRRISERLQIDLDRRTRDLSTGNRRKVALLLAFAPQPNLLILDEPTSGLDPLMQHEFLEMVREARDAGVTVFLSSHVLSEVQRAADRVVVLRAGKIVLEGTVDEIRRRARQHLEVWFAEDVEATELTAISGLAEPTLDGRRFTATVSGSIEPTLAVLARHRVASLVVDEPDLEETFLELYGDSDP